MVDVSGIVINMKIKTFLIFFITIFLGSLTYADLVDLGYSATDIVLSAEVVWESPLRACVYRTYLNPTDIDYYSSLESTFEINEGNVMDKGVEIKVNYLDKIEIITQNCTKEYDKLNDSYYELCEDIIEIKIVNKSKWIRPIDFKFEPKQSYEIRQCVERNNILDNFEVEVHTPFLGYDLKEYTIITSSGYNQTIYDKGNHRYKFNNVYTDNWGSLDGTGQNSPTFVNDQYGTSQEAVNLDGVNQYVTTSSSTIIDANSDFSIVMSVRIDDDSLVGAATLYGEYASDNDRWGFDFEGSGSSDGEGVRFFYRAGGVSTIGLYCAYNFVNGNWYNISLVRSSTYFQFYIDGNLQCNVTDASTTASNTGGVRIGAFTYSGLKYFDGAISDLKLFDSSITTNEMDYWYEGNPDLGIYGAYNSSGTFRNVWFNFTSVSGKTCDSTDINISRSEGSYTALSGDITHEFASRDSGFYLRVNIIDCENVWMNITNITVAPVDPSYNQTIYDKGNHRYKFNNVYTDNWGSLDGTGQNSPTFVNDQYGTSQEAVNLDGVNQYVTTSSSTIIDANSDFSIVMSVRIDDDSLVGAATLYGEYASDNDRWGFDFEGSGSSDGEGVRFFYRAGGVSTIGLYCAYNFVNGNWYNISLVRSSTYFQFYIDGNLQCNVTDASTTASNTGGVRIGAFTYSGLKYFDGAISDLKLFDSSITTNEMDYWYEGNPDLGIYGAYNSSGTFRNVWFNFTSVSGKTCDSTDINISRSEGSYTALSGDITHEFASKDFGFYLRIDTIDCAYVWLNMTNTTGAPTDSCTCPGDSSAHEFDCSDNCEIANCIAGDITFINAGTINCTNLWKVDILGEPSNGCTLYIDNNCYINTTTTI